MARSRGSISCNSFVEGSQGGHIGGRQRETHSGALQVECQEIHDILLSNKTWCSLQRWGWPHRNIRRHGSYVGAGQWTEWNRRVQMRGVTKGGQSEHGPGSGRLTLTIQPLFHFVINRINTASFTSLFSKHTWWGEPISPQRTSWSTIMLWVGSLQCRRRQSSVNRQRYVLVKIQLKKCLYCVSRCWAPLSSPKKRQALPGFRRTDPRTEPMFFLVRLSMHHEWFSFDILHSIANTYVVFLKTPFKGRNDYINAVNVPVSASYAPLPNIYRCGWCFRVTKGEMASLLRSGHWKIPLWISGASSKIMMYNMLCCWKNSLWKYTISL
mgnify:CR=1 FL=1